MSFDIRRLGPEDANAYRTLRLSALADAPFAFSDSVEEAEGRPNIYWCDLLAGERTYYGAFSGPKLVGSANYTPEIGNKSAHRGWMHSVYVAPAARGLGVVDLLIKAVIDHARGVGALQVHLGVGTENLSAQRAYQRFGFEAYGTQPRALRVQGQFIDEHQMVLFLDK
ncbi:MAG: GNAT family N-acetyltransferase [Hyphomicrobiaceae bacterium]|nr:GNAT family N-acetyltransferase [Hyphomicrobiaceae bacterium]